MTPDPRCPAEMPVAGADLSSPLIVLKLSSSTRVFPFPVISAPAPSSLNVPPAFEPDCPTECAVDPSRRKTVSASVMKLPRARVTSEKVLVPDRVSMMPPVRLQRSAGDVGTFEVDNGAAPLAPIVPNLVMLPASVMVPPERATTCAPDLFVRPPVSDTCAPDPLASISPKLSMLPAAIIVPLAVAWIRPNW